jgi:hypothetical protein
VAGISALARDAHASTIAPPFGPWITTRDEAPDPHSRDIRCLVNGETRQASTTRNLVFDVWAQVEHLSQAVTLEPGDVIFTGTPGGVGAAMNPRVFLRPGDVVRVEVEGLGAIENRCAAEIAKMSQTLSCEVLIVGLGPVGAVLAALLCDAGVEVIAIDKSAEVYPLPRAAHFDHEIMRIFQQVGIAEEVLRHARSAKGYEFRSASGEVQFRAHGRADALGLGLFLYVQPVICSTNRACSTPCAPGWRSRPRRGSCWAPPSGPLGRGPTASRRRLKPTKACFGLAPRA